MEPKKYLEVLIQAAARQRKRYAAMKNALKIEAVRNGRVVLAISSLILVDQIYDDLLEIKNDEEWDYVNVSSFYCILMIFIKQTAIFVDEGHLFLDDTMRRIELNEMWGLIQNILTPVYNMSVLNRMGSDVDENSFEIRRNNYISKTIADQKIHYLKCDTNKQTRYIFAAIFSFHVSPNKAKLFWALIN